MNSHYNTPQEAPQNKQCVEIIKESTVTSPTKKNGKGTPPSLADIRKRILAQLAYDYRKLAVYYAAAEAGELSLSCPEIAAAERNAAFMRERLEALKF